MNKLSNISEDEVNIFELWMTLRKHFKFIATCSSATAIFSLAFSLFITDIYRAEVLLSPVDPGDGNGFLSSQLGSAASLVGIDLGSQQVSKINTAIAILNSREFISGFIEDEKLLIPLFAGKWNPRLEELEIDQNIYDSKNQSWLLKGGAPTDLMAYRKFDEILSVNGPDRITGLVTVAVEWIDPMKAAQWANQIVAYLNKVIRDKDVSEATDAIAYLSKQAESTQLLPMQRVFSSLIESQTRIAMLADIREEYVLQVIDKAVVPDRKFLPRRSIYLIVGFFIGFALSLLVALYRSSKDLNR